MRPIILMVLSLFACAAASDTIQPLYETSSTSGYNQWLLQHRTEYPEFRQVLTQADFFNDSGATLPSQVLEYGEKMKDLVGLQTPMERYLIEREHCIVSYGQGQVVTSTAYDLHRHRLFERTGQIYPRFNLWFRDTEDSTAAWRHFHPEIPSPPESTEVLDDEGKIVGVLPRVPMRLATSSGDTLIAVVSQNGTLVLDREARVRWQDGMFGTAPRVAAVSPDGQKVAVVVRDSVGIHDLVTGTNRVLGIPSSTVMGHRYHFVVWSSDSRHFAMYRADSYGPGSAMLWVFTRDGRSAAKPRKLDANYGEQLFWMGDTVVLATTPYVDSLQERLRDKHWFVGPSRVTAVPLRGRGQTWIVKGRFGEGSDWFQQGRCLASVCKSVGDAVVFQVPVK
jgi:hypothetical protein